MHASLLVTTFFSLLALAAIRGAASLGQTSEHGRIRDARTAPAASEPGPPSLRSGLTDFLSRYWRSTGSSKSGEVVQQRAPLAPGIQTDAAEDLQANTTVPNARASREHYLLSPEQLLVPKYRPSGLLYEDFVPVEDRPRASLLGGGAVIRPDGFLQPLADHGQLVTGTAGSATAGGKPAARARVPSALIAVFSRRESMYKRSLIRDMWLKAMGSSSGNVSVKFALCAADDSLTDVLGKEHTVHGDLLVLPCAEGAGGSLLTEKTISSLQAFRDRFPMKELFVKMHDDTFVAWRTFSAFLADRGSPAAYMGVPHEQDTVCRNSLSPQYEPYAAYPNDRFPLSFASGTGYVLGRKLALSVLTLAEKSTTVMWNEDRAIGVWVDALRQEGTIDVQYVPYNGVTSWQAWAAQELSWQTGRKWGDYPYMVHHGLAGETIGCLSLADVADNAEASIDHCLAFELGLDHPAEPPCLRH